MKNELTIYHIARRLSCGVKGKTIGKTIKGKLLEFDIIGGVGDLIFIKDKDGISQQWIENIKLILHPLSDLIKPITHKGETFVPMVKLGEGIYTFTYKELLDEIRDELVSYWIIEKLLEWHFVIDEPEGTWIDVNTLEKNCYE